jgi:hypothetical protein
MLGAVTLWQPLYRIDGAVKRATRVCAIVEGQFSCMDWNPSGAKYKRRPRDLLSVDCRLTLAAKHQASAVAAIFAAS